MKQWIWILYPVLVGVFIVFTAIYIVSDPTRWVAISQKRNDTQQQEAQISLLRQKLSVLSSLDKNQIQSDLTFLVEAIPPSRYAWSLLSELKIAASDSGVNIIGYKAQVGNVKESAVTSSSGDALLLNVTAEVPDIVRLRRFLGSIYAYKPLVRLNKLTFAAGSMQLALEGGWQSWSKESTQEGPLPEYLPMLQEVKSRLSTFKSLPVVSTQSAVQNFGVTNPF